MSILTFGVFVESLDPLNEKNKKRLSDYCKSVYWKSVFMPLSV